MLSSSECESVEVLQSDVKYSEYIGSKRFGATFIASSLRLDSFEMKLESEAITQCFIYVFGN